MIIKSLSMTTIKSLTILAILVLCFSCTKVQFKGGHVSESKQKIIEEKTSSYHAKEANRVIEENKENRKVNEKHREKRRKHQEEYLAKLNNSNKVVKKAKRRVNYNFY